MGFLMDVFVASFSVFRPKRDDDGTDRLHYFVTSNLLIGLSVLTGHRMVNGRAVKCMMPDFGFKDGWMSFVDNYCWIQGTYFLPDRRAEPPSPRELHKIGQNVRYYHWVPMFLIFEAVCFSIPRMFWNSSCHGSGIRIADIVDMAREKANFKAEIRKNTINILSTHLKNALAFHKRVERRNLHKWFRPGSLKYTSCYVTIVYLTMKLLFFVNALLQFKLMNLFLFNNMSGIGHIQNVIRRDPWNTTGYFPRVSYCVVGIPSMGNRVQNHTIQCVLTINLFNEKIFFFLWFWYLFLMILTGLSTIYWAIVLLLPSFAQRYMVRHLKLADQPFNASENQYHLDRFVRHYLQQDGVLVLRMISLHTGVIFATQLCIKLWNDYFGFSSIVEAKQENEKNSAIGKKEGKKKLSNDGLINVKVLGSRFDKFPEMTQPGSRQRAKYLRNRDDDDEYPSDQYGQEDRSARRDDRRKVMTGGQQRVDQARIMPQRKRR